MRAQPHNGPGSRFFEAAGPFLGVKMMAFLWRTATFLGAIEIRFG
jgi:hypothetical protein